MIETIGVVSQRIRVARMPSTIAMGIAMPIAVSDS